MKSNLLPLRGKPAANAGFTLVELLVVMGILGVLAAAIMPLSEAMFTAQKERELRHALWEIRNAIDAYKRETERGAIPAGLTDSGYPPSLSALALGVRDVRAPNNNQKLYFLRQVPRDPFADPSLPAEQTWRLRSYASPPDQPKSGADVFDVRSSSDAMALDGTAYAGW